MAHLYAGDITRVAPDIVSAARALPDDMTLFAEFDIAGRNVDVLALRPRTATSSTLIAAEIKHASQPIRGTDNGPWEIRTEGGTWELWQTRYRDKNAYRQAVATANAVAEWLWVNQPRFLARTDGPLPKNVFTIWPDVIIQSPPGVDHLLPLGPSSRYGAWFYGLDTWLQHVVTWIPRASVVSLEPGDVSRLADILGLCPVSLHGSTRSAVATVTVGDDAPLHALVTWLSQVERRLTSLESRLTQLDNRPVSM